MILIHPNKKVAKDDLGIFYRIEGDKLIDPSINEPFYWINLFTGDLIDENGNSLDYEMKVFNYPKDLLDINLESIQLTIDEYLAKSKEITGFTVSKATLASTIIRKIRIYVLNHINELMENIFQEQPDITRRECYTAFADLLWNKLYIKSEEIWKELAPAISHNISNLLNPQDVIITDLYSIKSLFADPEKAILTHIQEDVYKVYITVGQKINHVDNPDIVTLDDLLKATIEKNQMLTVDPKFKIETNDRDKPFIFVDDHLVYGKPGDFHGKIFKDYFATKGIEVTETSYWPRSLADIKVLNNRTLDDTQPFGAGCVKNDIAIIEAEENNALPKMLNLLKSEYSKVYILYKAQNRIKRLAKRAR